MKLEISRLVHCYSWPTGKHTMSEEEVVVVVSRRKSILCVGCSGFFSYIRITSSLFFLWFESVMLIAWHISPPFLYVMVGYYIYISLFSPSFFSGGTPKSHYFFLPPLVDVAGNSSRVMTSRWDSFFLSFHSSILCQRGFGGMNKLYVRARTGLDAGLWRALRSHLLRSIANKISIGIFFLKFFFLLWTFFFFFF